MKVSRSVVLATIGVAAALPLALRLPTATTEALHTTPVWTHVGSACTPDEASRGKYSSNESDFNHRGTVLGGIAARCNIVNLTDFGAGEAQVLEVVYRDQDGPGSNYRVRAFLKYVRNSDGQDFTIATFDSNAFGASLATQTHHVFVNHHFNFAPNAYYVTLIIDRADATRLPVVSVVRLTEIVL
jgi:hypothetical protein